MSTPQERRELRPSEAIGPLTRYNSPFAYFPVRDIPTAGYLAENIACAVSSICASTLGLLVMLPLMPLAILRSLVPRRKFLGTQVVVLTGSSGQIGGAFLQQYDTPAYHLVLLLRPGSEFERPKRASFETHEYDQAKSSGKDLKALFKDIAQKHDGIDILVAVSCVHLSLARPFLLGSGVDG